jgi:hypothetical protein
VAVADNDSPHSELERYGLTLGVVVALAPVNEPARVVKMMQLFGAVV